MATQVIGRYQVVRVLGSGGFATVYLARDATLETDVAVKVLAENWAANDDITRRFLDEARVLRRCDGNHVVRVHTIEELDDGRPYFVMEYADGGTLAERLRTPPKLRVDEAIAISSDIAAGLTVVHDHGLVHRDLKPSNVLFRRGEVVLGDFGLARDMVEAGGSTIYAGTPTYIAPEQADPTSHAQVDARADIYAAAVVLYEMVAGRPPFQLATLADAARPRGDPPPLTGVEPSLAAAVQRGLAFDPDARYPTARAWQQAITAPDVAPTVIASPPPVAGRDQRRAFAAAAFVAIAVIAGLIAYALRRPSTARTTAGAAVTAAPTTTAAPPTTTTIAAPQPGLVAGWFAAASGDGCMSEPAASPVVDEVSCTQGGIDAVFRAFATTSNAVAFLQTAAAGHPGAMVQAWASGQIVSYPEGKRTVLIWSYTGQPYVGQASGPTDGVIRWWQSTGRLVVGQTPAPSRPGGGGPGGKNKDAESH